MAKQYFTVSSHNFYADPDSVPNVVFLYEVDMVRQYWCSPYNPFHSARIIGICAIDNDLDAVRHYKFMWQPSLVYDNLPCEFVEKVMDKLTAKNVRDARREVQAYWRKGDIYHHMTDEVVHEGTWYKADKAMPKL